MLVLLWTLSLSDFGLGMSRKHWIIYDSNKFSTRGEDTGLGRGSDDLRSAQETARWVYINVFQDGSF